MSKKTEKKFSSLNKIEFKEYPEVLTNKDVLELLGGCITILGVVFVTIYIGIHLQ